MSGAQRGGPLSGREGREDVSTKPLATGRSIARNARIWTNNSPKVRDGDDTAGWIHKPYAVNRGDLYSERNASTGSTRIARITGGRAARIAAVMRAREGTARAPIAVGLTS